MTDESQIREGQVLTGPLFNEPMRVVTVRPNGADSVVAGLVGQRTEQFRQVTLTSVEMESLSISEAVRPYDGDGGLLKIGLEAYSLGIAHEFDLTSAFPSPVWTRCRTNSKRSTSIS